MSPPPLDARSLRCLLLGYFACEIYYLCLMVLYGYSVSQGSNNIQASRRIKTLERHCQINAHTLNTTRDFNIS